MRSTVSSVTVMVLCMSIVSCQPIPPSRATSTQPSSLSDVRIRSAHSNWIEEKFQTEIVNIGLEKLGYQIEPVKEIDYPAIYLSIANEDLDYSVINYEIAHEEFYQNSGGDEKLEKVGLLVSPTVGGYQIDKKTAARYNITNIEQLKDPKISQLFDSDGDGKANLTGCNPGWGCELVIEHHLDAYQLRKTIEHDKGQYSALIADAITRYNNGKPILYFAYNPHWISSILKPDEDVVWLEVPFTALPDSQRKLSEQGTILKGKNLGFSIGRQRIVGNRKFLSDNPVAKSWFEQVQISVEDMNAESLRIKNGESRAEQIRRHAEEWIANHQEQFDGWLESAKIAGGETMVTATPSEASNPSESEAIAKPLGALQVILNPFELYTIPLDDWITAAIDFLVENFRPLFQAIRIPIDIALETIESLLLVVPPLIFLVVASFMTWQFAGGKLAVYSLVALTFLGFVGAWEQAMVSLSLVGTAVVFCIAIGFPIGIACARSDRLERWVRPLLDAMQTLPTFVYLVPVVMLFGIGEVPGVIATIIYALPPLIRLTNLGIRQVSPEAIEAATAFGSTPLQVLWNVQIPLAMPTILAGLNQTVLFALGMSVITAMIAVPGLGLMVLQGVGRLDVGLAAVGGLGIVLLAVMLDRITQAVGKADDPVPWQERGPIGFLRSQPSQNLMGAVVGVAILLIFSLGWATWQQTPEPATKSQVSEIPRPGDGTIVRVGSGTSSSDRFATKITNMGLEKLGYQVQDPKEMTAVSTLHIAVSQGDLEFYSSHWERLHEGFFQEAGGNETLERIGVIVPDVLQGYQIDRKTADEYNITSLEQLKDPKIAQLFDSDGDGKANLIGCIPGWSCELVINHHLQAYGLQDTVEHIQGDYSVLMADTLARYRQGKPVLYYTWTPNWVASSLKIDRDVTWLTVPFTTLPKSQGQIAQKDTTIDGKNLGFATDRIRIVGNKEFLAAHPAAKRWFEGIQIPLEDLNAEEARFQEGENQTEDIHRHAQEWIEQNQELFDRWLDRARQA